MIKCGNASTTPDGKTISREVVGQNPWTTFTREEFTGVGGLPGTYLVVERPPAVMILPLVRMKGEAATYLVRQYRYPVERFVWQFPMGKVEPGEDFRESARRELIEETGLVPRQLVELGSFYVDPGLSRQECYVFVADGIEEYGNPQLEESERGLTTSVVTLNDLRALGSTWLSDSWGYLGACMLYEYIDEGASPSPAEMT